MTQRSHGLVDGLLDVPDAARKGSVIVARVHLGTGEDAPVGGGRVVLTRTIAYRYRDGGDRRGTHLATARRTDEVASQVLPARVGERLTEPYQVEALLAVPDDGPASVDTELVLVDWAVRARLDLGPRGTAQDVRKVRVLTEAADFASAASAPGRGDARGHTSVTLDNLSSRWIAPGAHLTGDVVVVPLHPGQIRSVRVELVMREVVPQRSGTGVAPMGATARTTAVVVTEPADHIEALEAWRRLVVPFAVDVPNLLRAPSVATPEFEIGWALRAVVVRPLHRDAYAEVPLRAATVRPG